MFIGHFGAGLIGKKIDKLPSLGTMLLAAQLIDLVWPILLLLGIERVEIDPGNTLITPLNFVYYPFTHSLLFVLLWGIAFGGVYFMLKKNLKSALLLGSLVVSHWFLDLLVHRPDLPLTLSNENFVGFNGWNSLVITLLLELGIFFTGVYFYNSVTKAKNKVGTIGFWSLVVFLIITYFANLFGPVPPDTNAIAFGGLAMWLLVAWAYWVDKNREYI